MIRMRAFSSSSSSSSFILHFLVNLLLIFGSFFVNSQQSDSCSSSLNLNGLVSFQTTSLRCHSVWNAQGYILRYLQNGPNLWSFVLSAPNTNAFVAIGFSPNGRMVGSSAMVGWVPNNGPGMVKQYFLGATNPNQVIPDQGNLQVVDNSTRMVSQSSRLYLSFQLNTTQPSTLLIYSVGPSNFFPSANFRLVQHRDMVSTRLNYQSGQSSSTGTPYTRLRKTHGLLNMVGWGIMMMIGALAARYLRRWDPMWFYAHSLIQLLSFMIGVSGVIAGFVLENHLDAQVDKHKTIGIFILVLGCLQVMALLARPNPESKVRKYWTWYHRSIGSILLILAVSNVFYGIHVGDEENSWNVGYGIALAIIVVVAVFLEVRMRMRK